MVPKAAPTQKTAAAGTAALGQRLVRCGSSSSHACPKRRHASRDLGWSPTLTQPRDGKGVVAGGVPRVIPLRLSGVSLRDWVVIDGTAAG